MKSVHLSLDEDRITCTSLTKRVALRRLILTGDLMTAVLNQTLPPSNHFLGLVAAWPATRSEERRVGEECR